MLNILNLIILSGFIAILYGYVTGKQILCCVVSMHFRRTTVNVQNLSIFSESAKIKNYDAAYDTWKAVLEACPDLHLAIYTYGEKILKHKIKTAQVSDKKAITENIPSDNHAEGT